MEHAICVARNCNLIDKIVVYTADEDVKKTVQKYPTVVIENEPEHLCKPDTPISDVIKDVEKKHYYDILVWLQPTSPIRDSTDIDKCIKILLYDDSIDSVVTIRRHLKYLFYPNGNIYVARRGKEFYNDNMACLVINEQKSVDVDTLFNFNVAKMILEGEN